MVCSGLLVWSYLMWIIALTNMINLYLGSKEEAQISSLIKSDDKALLSGYVHEALSKCTFDISWTRRLIASFLPRTRPALPGCISYVKFADRIWISTTMMCQGLPPRIKMLVDILSRRMTGCSSTSLKPTSMSVSAVTLY